MVGLYLDALSQWQTVLLLAPPIYSGTSSCYLTATFLLSRKIYYSYGYLCIVVSLLGIRSIVCIEIGNTRLSLLLIYTYTSLTMPL